MKLLRENMRRFKTKNLSEQVRQERIEDIWMKASKELNNFYKPKRIEFREPDEFIVSLNWGKYSDRQKNWPAGIFITKKSFTIEISMGITKDANEDYLKLADELRSNMSDWAKQNMQEMDTGKYLVFDSKSDINWTSSNIEDAIEFVKTMVRIIASKA